MGKKKVLKKLKSGTMKEERKMSRSFEKKGKKRFKNFPKRCIIKLPLKNGEAERVFSA
jgi:hypothetical protein